MKRSLLPLLAVVLASSPSFAQESGSASTNTATMSEMEHLGLVMNTVNDRQVTAVSPFSFFSGDVNPEILETNFADLYTGALKAQKVQRLARLSRMLQAVREEHAAIASFAEKSLMEREQERAEANSAIPEASPATTPFSLSHPEPLVLNDESSAVEFLQTPVTEDPAGLAATPEPATWALFGLGGAWLALTKIRRGKMKLAPIQI